MNFFDYFSIAIIIWFAFKGYKNGIILEFATGIGIVVGLILGNNYYSALANNLQFLIENETTGKITAFVSLFLSSIILANICGLLLKQIMNFILLGKIDRVLGGFFGIIKAIIILKIGIMLIGNIPLANNYTQAANESLVEITIQKNADLIFKEIYKYLPQEFIN